MAKGWGLDSRETQGKERRLSKEQASKQASFRPEPERGVKIREECPGIPSEHWALILALLGSSWVARKPLNACSLTFLSTMELAAAAPPTAQSTRAFADAVRDGST